MHAILAGGGAASPLYVNLHVYNSIHGCTIFLIWRETSYRDKESRSPPIHEIVSFITIGGIKSRNKSLQTSNSIATVFAKLVTV